MEENGSVRIDASSITIEALNSAEATNTKAYAIETLSGGNLELGNENTSLIRISSETSSSTELGGAGRDNRAIRASDSSNIALSASEISIEASGYNTTAIEAVNGGQVVIGNESSNVSISSIGSSQVVGVRSDDVNSSINITADTVSIHTENTSEDGYSVGLMALNNSQSSTRPEDSASINITANNTTITSDGVGISAYSNSRVNLDTGLVLNAPTAIEARGNSLLNINPNGDKTVVIEGDVSFGTAATGSGNILDAEVNINLSGAQSQWKGNVKVDYPTNGNTDTTIAKGVTLSLSDQAQWTPNKIAETDADGQTVKAQALNVLKLNDGVVNLGSDLGTVEIKELQGTGGTINAEATKDDDGSFVLSTVRIDEVSNTDGSTPSMTVNYTGITADDLSNVASDMKSLADQTIKTGTQDAVDQTFNIEEGNIRGAVTSGYDADGNLLTHQAKNAKLTDYGALNSMTFVQWRNEINHLTKRLGDIRASESNIGAWARVYGGESQWKSNSEIEMDHTTIQVGADYRINKHWIVGGAFSYTDSDADLVKGQAKGDSYSLAAYATYMADGGSYLDLIARYGYLDNEMTSGNMSVDTQSNAFSLSVETGHMFRIMEQAYIEPQIEVTYGFISGDDATASNGVRLDQDDFQSLIIKEHITHALMRYASEHKAAIRTAANRTAQDSSAARSQLPALPAGLFVPSRFFTGPIALWISPLQALGLAVSCTREVSEAADNESESQTETMIALYRHSPGNPLPETGVLFPFFESVSAAIWWVEHMSEFHRTKLSEATRKDVLKQFLFTDAMARLLRLFIRETREADQEIGNRLLAQSAALTQNQTGERTKRELQKFVKPKLLRKLCSASIAEVAHGYLTHELRRKGEADVSTGLEIVLDIQKRQLAAARSKRMKRVVARPDS